MNNSLLKNLIEKALAEVGLNRGDVVLVHSDASAVIKLLGDEDWNRALELMRLSFAEILGDEGTLVVPTFNWNFCKGHPYDEAKTPSQLGLFSNYILNRPEAIRSIHPFFSFSGIGPHARSLFSGISKSSFGPESVFDRLMQRNGKLIFFNTSFLYCTFIHYVEQMRGVSYRYIKHFTGKLTVNKVTYEDTFEFYVRDEKQEVISYPTRLGERMRSKGMLRSVSFGDGRILSTTCHEVFHEAVTALDEDPYFLLKQPPVPVGNLKSIEVDDER